MPAQPNQYQQGNNNGSQMNNNVPQQPGPQTNMQVAELDPQQTQNNNQQKQKPKKPNNSNAPAKPQ